MSKIFTMTGRMNRAKYLLVMLRLAIPPAIIQGIEQWQPNAILQQFYASELIVFAAIIYLVSFILTICPVVQRWHDLDRPGTYWFLSLIPVLNIIPGLILLVAKGTKGPNQYGDDPLKRASPPSTEGAGATPSAPPKIPGPKAPTLPTEDRLAKLRALHEQGLVSDEAYASKQEEILRNL
jgi:uncharacterized membrane protein YhaH (DUF805 family)